MDLGDRKLLDDVERIGWHMIGVPEDEKGPDFVYSIGLFHSFKHAEIIVVGMELKLMFWMVNEIGSWAKSGKRVGHGDVRDGLLDGYSCTFRTVGKQRYRDYFGYAKWFYRNDHFPVLQCVWPDKAGRWPWDPDFNPHWKCKQPVLE